MTSDEDAPERCPSCASTRVVEWVYFCSTLIRKGASVEAVRQLAGHSKLAVTQGYVHANAADLTEAIAKLSAD